MSESIAIILAAGIGSRLRPMTSNIPKCLIPVAGRTILQWQIDAFLASGVRRIIVVAGYKSDQVYNFCRHYPNAVDVVVNQQYEHTNNMYSLYIAARNFTEQSVMLCNGDVVFDSQIIMLMQKSQWRDLIAIQPNQFYDESMKINVNSSNRILQINKAISPSMAYGVSIDVYKFSPEAMKQIMKIASRIIVDEGEKNLWTEVAINEALQLIDFRPFDIGNHRWVEIDNIADLTLANEIFANETRRDTR